tara:strand:- start:1883 stop:2398 length:516 start_codon:yes stop_codon:yes gene_type:complete
MSDKAALFKDYLSQQADNVFINGLLDPDNIQMHSNRLPVHDQNDENDENDEDFERFKAIVKYYIKTDNEIKDIKSKVKLLHSETKKRQKILESVSPTIMEFMSKNDIDELNSKDGVIKYKKSMVKSPLTHKMLKDQLYEKFGSADEVKKALDKIFKERDKVEKQSLKRIAY